jgi:hypothetical protein
MFNKITTFFDKSLRPYINNQGFLWQPGFETANKLSFLVTHGLFHKSGQEIFQITFPRQVQLKKEIIQKMISEASRIEFTISIPNRSDLLCWQMVAFGKGKKNVFGILCLFINTYTGQIDSLDPVNFLHVYKQG